MDSSKIRNLKQVANFLRCEEEFLARYLSGGYYIIDRRRPSDFPDNFDRISIIEKLYLPKKNKRRPSYRETYSVRTDTLKSIHKGLNTYLKEFNTPSSAVHGYVKGRNIRTNAEVHLAKRHLLSVDISNFFESISTIMIEQVLCDVGFSKFAAQHLANVVTINNFLPAGFNTSPTISNLVMRNMDEQLILLCGKECAYTRYADDLYFSSNISLPSFKDIESIIIANDFSLNSKKTKYMPRGGKQYVTGLTVFDSIRPRVTKRIKRNLRLELHYLVKYGLRGHALKQLGYSIEQYEEDQIVKDEVDTEVNSINSRVSGWIRFMNSVERPAARRLEVQYQKVEL